MKKLKLSDLVVETLMCVSGKFKGSQVKWQVSQRELHPIVHSFFRFNFLLLNSAKTVNIATDHSALRYILTRRLQKINRTHNDYGDGRRQYNRYVRESFMYLARRTNSLIF